MVLFLCFLGALHSKNIAIPTVPLVDTRHASSHLFFGNLVRFFSLISKQSSEGRRVAPSAVPLRNPKGTSQKTCLETTEAYMLKFYLSCLFQCLSVLGEKKRMHLFHLQLVSFCLQFVFFAYGGGTISKKETEPNFRIGGTVRKKDQTALAPQAIKAKQNFNRK